MRFFLSSSILAWPIFLTLTIIFNSKTLSVFVNLNHIDFFYSRALEHSLEHGSRPWFNRSPGEWLVSFRGLAVQFTTHI